MDHNKSAFPGATRPGATAWPRCSVLLVLLAWTIGWFGTLFPVSAQHRSSSATSTSQLADDDEPVGSAILHVTVVDRFGAPLENAIVRLSGLVDRKATSNAAGIASFEALPDGRYDVVAEAGALAPSAPRVIDLTAFRLTSLEVTLKPRSPIGRAMIACGGFDARSLSTLAATAHLVVHVKVLEQHTIEPPPDDDRSPLASTVNLAEVREWLKHAPGAQPAGPILLVRQGGGRIDRGDHVEYHHRGSAAEEDASGDSGRPLNPPSPGAPIR